MGFFWQIVKGKMFCHSVQMWDDKESEGEMPIDAGRGPTDNIQNGHTSLAATPLDKSVKRVNVKFPSCNFTQSK